MQRPSPKPHQIQPLEPGREQTLPTKRQESVETKKPQLIHSECETVHTLQPDQKTVEPMNERVGRKFKLEVEENSKSLLYQISLVPLSPEKIHFRKMAPVRKNSFRDLLRAFREDEEKGRLIGNQEERNGSSRSRRKYSLESPNPTKLKVLGKLMHSQGKFKRKRQKKKQKISKFRIKKKKRGFLCRKPIDCNKLRRNLLRKRRRDISRDKTPAGMPKCSDCNNFLAIDQRRRTAKPEFNQKKKPRKKPNRFPTSQCWNCRKANFKRTQLFYKNTAKNLVANYGESDQEKPREKLFFRRLIKRYLPSKSISPEKSENSARSNSSGLSDLSDISLQNKKIKKERARMFKRAKKVRQLPNPNKEIFLSQCKRGGEYMEVFTSEKERIIFPEKIKDRLHKVSVDDDFDTDEEQLKMAVNKVFEQFVKGLEQSKRMEAKKRRLHMRNSLSNF